MSSSCVRWLPSSQRHHWIFPFSLSRGHLPCAFRSQYLFRRRKQLSNLFSASTTGHHYVPGLSELSRFYATIPKTKRGKWRVRGKNRHYACESGKDEEKSEEDGNGDRPPGKDHSDDRIKRNARSETRAETRINQADIILFKFFGTPGWKFFPQNLMGGTNLVTYHEHDISFE